MRPEGAFQRTQERMQEVISGRGLMHLLSKFVCEWYVVGVPPWARATLERGLETAEMG